MKRILLGCVFGSLLILPAAAAGLADRITHYDVSKTANLKAVHDGAGTMNFGPLMTDKTLSTNLLFLHRGVLHAHGGIGQHFHNHCEEMFVIFDGEAEFTINGRTSTLKGTWGAPDRMGSSHAIYNPTDHDVEWMNINVGTSKVYDAFNLGDDRVGAPQDKIPQFVTMHLDRALMKPAAAGSAVQRRRALGPSVFYTAWSYLDHMLIQPGGTTGSSKYADMSEAFYVMSGDGTVTVNGETVAIRKGDAIPVDLGQAKNFKAGSQPLELLVIGVARDMAAKNAFAANPANENAEPLLAVLNKTR
ncbi:MAG TPA: cupin domain-containing protein [Rhizomicrobium sp.]|jgi:mannose-6-phosphate isomerase-like protein (cupin superfamily)|nr:cupin domain-containing protein [Rhizomicrobium sp.]